MKKYLVKINIFFLLLIFTGNGMNIFAKDNPNSVSFLNVGNKYCILIKSNIENILIDVGEKKYENNILDYLKKEGVEELDAIILTNFNNKIDFLHIILENLKVNKVYLSNFCDNKKNKDFIIKELEEKNIKYDFIKKGWSYSKGNIYLEAKAPIENTNYNSVILYGVIDKVKYLFASDFLFNSKKDIKHLNNIRSIDVLKISNNGKKDFINKEIIRYLNPYVVVMNCKKIECDSYIESLLKKKKKEVYTTQKNGNIKIQRNLGSKKIDVVSEK